MLQKFSVLWVAIEQFLKMRDEGHLAGEVSAEAYSAKACNKRGVLASMPTKEVASTTDKLM